MPNQIDQSHDDLNDNDLLNREADQRSELLRLEQLEPRLKETTYGIMSGSGALLHAWERWFETEVAARLRGLLPRGPGR